jgi:hypothetical protein
MLSFEMSLNPGYKNGVRLQAGAVFISRSVSGYPLLNP